MATAFRRHLQARGLTPELAKYVHIDDVTEKVTFLLWELTGKLKGGIQYYWKGDKIPCQNNPDDRYFYCNSLQNGLFGLEFIDLTKIDVLYIVEGVWDAIRLISLGYPAVATIGSPNMFIKAQVKSMPCKTIAVLDGDMRCLGIVPYVDNVLTLPEGKDPNNMDPLELKKLLEGINNGN